MSKVLIVNRDNSSKNKLVIQNEEIPEPGDRQVLIRHSYLGLNYMDLARFNSPNAEGQTLGLEACGYIEKVGPKVGGFSVGERVAYATAGLGALRERRCVEDRYLVSVPESISDRMAAASLFKGLAAHYLVNRVFIVRKGDAVLVHAATGSVASLIAQMANNRGAVVIGTVGSDSKKSNAQNLGCHKVLNYTEGNWEQEVIDITKGIGVSVVYDSLGVKVFDGSLKTLMKMGLMVSYGGVTGLVKEVDMSSLAKSSLFLTVPSTYDYKQHRMELVLSAAEVFGLIAEEKVIVNIDSEYEFENANEAMHALQNRNKNGSVIISV